MQKRPLAQKTFRIGDLADKLEVKKFVIRFWEKEFSLNFERSDGGQRYYTHKDLETFQTIKDLLYHQGFTIPGARQQLHSKTSSAAAPLVLSLSKGPDKSTPALSLTSLVPTISAARIQPPVQTQAPIAPPIKDDSKTKLLLESIKQELLKLKKQLE